MTFKTISQGCEMEKLKPFYCYLNRGNPVVVEIMPADFSKLPFPYRANCPNIEIAKMAYQTNLKIMKWRRD